MASRILQILLIFVVLLNVAPCLGGATPGDDTVSGPAVPLPTDIEDSYRNIIQDVADSYGLEARGEVFLMYEEGVTYIVSSPRRPQAGVADVTGSVIRPEEAGTEDVGVIFVDSVSVSQSGPTISLSSLQQNEEKYTGRVVEVPGHYREGTVLNDVESVQTRQRLGYLSSEESTEQLLYQPGQLARLGSVNLSQMDGKSGERLIRLSVELVMGSSGNSSLMAAHQATSWWVDAPARVSILVLPEDFYGGVRAITLYPIDVEIREQETVTPDVLQFRGDELAGEVVTVRGQVIGSRLSSQETLLAAAKCAPDSIMVPSAGCIPLPTDVALHTGVVASSGNPSNGIPYAGLSNQHQDVPVTDEQGEYQLTGRVVETEQIDARLPDGYGLVVYERERVGPLDTSGGEKQELEAAAADVTDQLRSQLVMSHSTYRQTKDERHSKSPTPATASPTPTPATTNTGQTSESNGDVVVLNATVIQSTHDIDDPFAVKVRLLSGDSGGSKTLKFTHGGGEPLKTVEVTVPPNQETIQTIQVEIGDQRSYKSGQLTGSRIELNGIPIGYAEFEYEASEPESETEQEQGPIILEVNRVAAGGFAITSVGSILALVGVGMTRIYNSWRYGATISTRKHVGILFAAGSISAGGAMMFPGGIQAGVVLLFALVPIGLCYGWSWAIGDFVYR